MSEVNAVQVGGSHYKGTTFQHWDFVQSTLSGRYLEGNITKYLSRWRNKNGLQDLQKARHYLTKLIEQVNLGKSFPLYTGAPMPSLLTPEHFCDVNGIDEETRAIIVGISKWRTRAHLHYAGGLLDTLIAEVEAESEHGQEITGDGTGHSLPPLDVVDEEPGSGYVDQD